MFCSRMLRLVKWKSLLLLLEKSSPEYVNQIAAPEYMNQIPTPDYVNA